MQEFPLKEYLILMALICALFFYELPKLKELLKADLKNRAKIALHLFIFIFTTIMAIYVAAFYESTVSEEFSTNRKNVSFEGENRNIVLHPSRRVEEPQDLRTKDTFEVWQKGVHYVLKDDGSIFLTFIYKENQARNNWLADHGLSFTYKTKTTIFHPIFQYFKGIVGKRFK